MTIFRKPFLTPMTNNTLPAGHEETVENQQLSPFNTISTGSAYFRYWEEEDVLPIVHDVSTTRTPLQQCIHSMNVKEKIVNRVIESYISQILKHYRSSIIGGSAHLPYIEVFKTLSEPGIPHNVYNKVADSIGQNFYSETRSQSERLHRASSSSKFPGRKTLTTWIKTKVHPPELLDKSNPTQNKITLPTRQTVVVTTNNIQYQLAMIFSDQNMMDPENFLVNSDG